MKDVLIVAHFCDYGEESTNNRFNYIYNMVSTSCSVELITSRFSHRDKKHRENLTSTTTNITLVDEPGYKKNISFQRFFSHYIMSKNLLKYLNSRRKPDIIYCAVPSLDVAMTVARYCKKNNIKFIVDVQDLWPEAFKMIINIPILIDIIFYPFRRKAKYIYQSATNVVTVSDTYSQIIKKYTKSVKSTSVYLGTNLDLFDNGSIDVEIKKSENEIWVCYVGTLGHSYNIEFIIDAIKEIQNQGISNIKFIIMGDGPLKDKFEKYSEIKKIDCEFLGKVSYELMISILKSCDIAVNPIRKNSAGSIINKVGDYAAAGLPVINTQENLEYRHLLEEYKCGINCNNNDLNGIVDGLKYLVLNPEVRQLMGRNNRKLAEDKFDRKLTYKAIEDMILY